MSIRLIKHNTVVSDQGVPELSYRLTFYLCGLVFAVVTYVVGTWAYFNEVAAIESGTDPVTLWQCALSIFPAHPFTFITWITTVTIVSVLLGYLFDRETENRRRAEAMANIDGLTEAFNHRYFQDRLVAEIERAIRYERSLALVMLDLDNFKSFNDSHGHQQGDMLLKWFVKLCGKNIRSIDILARYGGEEFVIILPETNANDALAAAERIRKAMDVEFSQQFPGKAKVTTSAGVAAFPEHGNKRHSLILAADTALYYSKRQGKNTCHIYREDYGKVYEATPERLKALLGSDDIDAIEALSAAIDAKDRYSSRHSSSVSRYSAEIGAKLGLNEDEQECLRIAALLHDIGKIGTPESILHKPDKLASKERKVIESHPGLGCQILQKLQQFGAILPGVRHHHERYDGEGYPNKLSGKDIPLFARIIALADAFDAMTSDRPYRPALSVEEALEELSSCSGHQFDPELVALFAEIIRQKYSDDRSEAA